MNTYQQARVARLCDRVTVADDKIKGALETARDGAGFDGACLLYTSPSPRDS